MLVALVVIGLGCGGGDDGSSERPPGALIPPTLSGPTPPTPLLTIGMILSHDCGGGNSGPPTNITLFNSESRFRANREGTYKARVTFYNAAGAAIQTQQWVEKPPAEPGAILSHNWLTNNSAARSARVWWSLGTDTMSNVC